MNTIFYQKEAPIAGHYHTVVCGGGPAGWVAAVASARQGKRTALIERYGFLGGTATTGLVVPLSGCYHGGKRVVGGITWEFVLKMVDSGAALVELPKGHVSFDPEMYKVIAMDMVKEAGVDVYTNSYLVHCTKDNGRVTGVIIESKNGAEALTADYFIDATGDGDLAYMAGAPMMQTEVELQPMSMCFLLGGVDLTTDLLKNSIHHNGIATKQSLHTEIHDYLEELRKTHDVPQFGGPWFNTIMVGDLVTVNITRSGCNATNREEMTTAETRMRKDAYILVDLLREHFPEFKNAYIVLTAIQGGIRETRRIQGLYTVTGEDMMNLVDYPDAIALSAHPMDIHGARDNSHFLQHLPKAAKIPYRSIVPVGFKNLLSVGRCLSADRTAYASIRVQGTLMAIGEAAGTATAILDANDNVAAVDMDALHAKLLKSGSIFHD